MPALRYFAFTFSLGTALAAKRVDAVMSPAMTMPDMEEVE